ncbi:HU family DNA-binding protein [Desulforamulus ruminis]|uniref:Histone family protein DNA-binding protein n=1 Tax=Desulforamulus ruminis (strain ATCC 23193 / DSM 2154 / NCIMB 8452 / DL) TaxID=696281 RepID=F6DP29_DESRL|nr:HU family DNA-binding protein [Desulforamulus ruminis]AEG60748.1 histone family protein DNA-binding protein [Desulforamulus ruminis DSM 2154]
MNKKELVSMVAEKANLTQKDADRAVSAVLSSVEKALAKGDKIQLVGFGSFESKTRKAREGRNPQTGETIFIPANRVPVFKAGKTLKEAVGRFSI